MKKIYVFIVLAIISAIKLQAQTPYNPFLNTIHFDPEPTAQGFACGSLNYLNVTAGLTTIDSASDWQNNPLKIKIKIKGFTFALPANQTITGSYASNFDWALDTSINYPVNLTDSSIIIGTQKQTLHGTGNDPLFPDPLSSGEIIVALIANPNFEQGNVLRGEFSYIIPAYMQPFNSNSDDLEISQTQTFFTGSTLSSAGSITGSKIFCVSGDADTFISLSPALGSANGNYFYQWQEKINNVWIDIPGATELTFDAPATTQDRYYRRRAKGTVCDNWISTDSVSVRIDSLPIVGVDAGANTTLDCFNPTKLIGEPSKSGHTYKWLPAAGLNSDSIAQPLATPLVSTTYTLSVVDSNQCSSTDTIHITVINTATPVDAGADKFLDCKTLSAIIGPTSIGGNSYTWQPAIGLSATNIAKPTASPTVTTTYYVTVTDLDLCKAYDSVTVFVDRTTPFADADSNKTICNGDSVQIGTPEIQGNTYLWSLAAGLSATNIAQPIAKPLSTTTYTVVVTGTNGCTASDVVLIQRNICTINISGTVYLDTNALTNLKVDGVGISNPSNTPLYAIFADSLGIVLRVQAINPDGTFEFLSVNSNQNYQMIVSTIEGVVGNAAPLPSLPYKWIHTGEDCCDKNGDDGTVNGKINFSVAESDLPNIDFGIKQGFPLPLILKQFNVLENNCASLLSFTTIDEVNTKHIEIFRSDKTPSSFQKIATIQRSNTLANEKNYTYSDFEVRANALYEYQLKFVDVDDRYSLSDIRKISLDCDKTNESIRIYPNPTNSDLNILFNSNTEKSLIQFAIVDLTGRILYESNKETVNAINIFNIDISNFAKGVYFLRYRNEDGLFEGTIPFVKQ